MNFFREYRAWDVQARVSDLGFLDLLFIVHGLMDLHGLGDKSPHRFRFSGMLRPCF